MYVGYEKGCGLTQKLEINLNYAEHVHKRHRR
jgi:hypothetical protein